MATTITCDQAIFTSVRGPMGEGYRIIAASKGVKPEEKQAITRLSPSHDALCRADDTRSKPLPGAKPASPARDLPKPPPPPAAPFAKAVTSRPRRSRPLEPRPPAPTLAAPTEGKPLPTTSAVAFYALPTDRLCVAYSCFAGSEHTGRGGQRVYTINLIFDQDGFAACRYNPFNVVRGMERHGLTEPQLKPENVLPEVELSIDPNPAVPLRAVSVSPVRAAILGALLEDGQVLVNVDRAWLESAEAIMLSLPGPLRTAVGFSAGLRFSTSRPHRLQLLHDDGNAARTRSAGRQTRYIPVQENLDNAHAGGEQVECPAWHEFVERHWQEGSFAKLAARTSKPFEDISPPGMERVGRLYNHIDRLARQPSPEIIKLAGEHLEPTNRPVEDAIRRELVSAAQLELGGRFLAGPWSEVRPHWHALVELWKRPPDGTGLVQPLIAKALERGMADDPLEAASLALDMADKAPACVEPTGHRQLCDQVLQRLTEWLGARQGASAATPPEEDPQQHLQIRRVCERWRSLRPDCPIVRSHCEHADQLTAACAGTGKSC